MISTVKISPLGAKSMEYTCSNCPASTPFPPQLNKNSTSRATHYSSSNTFSNKSAQGIEDHICRRRQPRPVRSMAGTRRGRRTALFSCKHTPQHNSTPLSKLTKAPNNQKHVAAVWRWTFVSAAVQQSVQVWRQSLAVRSWISFLPPWL